MHRLSQSSHNAYMVRTMPKGPQGQKRPADAIGLAVLVGKIATGEAQDELAVGTGGASGGRARAAKLSAEERSEIARKAAAKRWSR